MTISLLTLKLFQNYMSFFLLNKEDILKIVGIQTVPYYGRKYCGRQWLLSAVW